MRIALIVALVLGAHLSITALAPGEAGKALFYWPFAKDSKPTFDFLGPTTKPVTQVLAILAGMCFLGGVAALFGWIVPATWWVPLVLAGSLSSLLLFLIYLSPLAILPLLIDAALLVGVLGLGWTVAGLRG